MKKETIAAAAAAIALSGAAGAHEFVCEKTIEGEVVHVVDSYPATLHFRIVVTNTHPTDASTALWMRDDALAKFLPAVPFTVEAGRSLELDAEITVKSRVECLKLSHARARPSAAGSGPPARQLQGAGRRRGGGFRRCVRGRHGVDREGQARGRRAVPYAAPRRQGEPHRRAQACRHPAGSRAVPRAI